MIFLAGESSPRAIMPSVELMSYTVTCVPAPAFYLSLIPTQDLRFIFLYFWNPSPPLLPLSFWSCLLTWSVTIPTCIHNMYHTIQNVWLCLINHQSQSMTQVPVIYHLGNILIALWRNSYAREIRFTIELQFFSKTPQRPLVFSVLRWIFCNIT